MVWLSPILVIAQAHSWDCYYLILTYEETIFKCFLKAQAVAFVPHDWTEEGLSVKATIRLACEPKGMRTC